jgi:hypothetical protein
MGGSKKGYFWPPDPFFAYKIRVQGNLIPDFIGKKTTKKGQKWSKKGQKGGSRAKSEKTQI